MRNLSVLLSFLGVALAAVAPLKQITKYDGETTGRHIVQLKPGTPTTELIKTLGIETTHEWEDFNSFAGQFSPATLLKLRSSSVVESIQEDGIMRINAALTQINAPWGISRVSGTARQVNTNALGLNFNYTFDSSSGNGVDAYVVDTGIFTDHGQFQGRAVWGATFGPYANADGNGHGTHCAGTIGSNQLGIAKNVTLIAVKVLADNGTGSVSDIISGLNWVRSTAASRGRPSVASLSFGGGASTALDSAVESLLSGGVHVSIAAGNENVDASRSSPARVANAITVGATTIADAKASFSNYGSVVDIHAPGQDIISTYIGGSNSAAVASGTSMAAPHVAGLIAYTLGLRGNQSPAALQAYLKSTCQQGLISGLPSGTANCLAHLSLS